MNLKLNVRMTLTINQAIDNEGREKILRFIRNQQPDEGEWAALNPNYGKYYLPNLPEELEWVWMADRGSFPKRIGSFYKKEHGIKCPGSFLQEIGNIARRHSQDDMTYQFDFVDEFDWDAGDFGDSGSCFWGGHAEAREMLVDGGARAIRFYDDDGEGVARAWIIPDGDELFIIFNGYGFPGNPTLIITQVFARHTGLTYKRIGLSNFGSDGGVLYINGGRGYAVGQPERVKDMRYHDLEIGSPYSCYECGDALYEDNMWRGADDMDYCEYCFDRLFVSCDECGEPEWRYKVIDVNGDYVCEYCLERRYEVCEKCGEPVHRRDMVNVKGHIYCGPCAPTK